MCPNSHSFTSLLLLLLPFLLFQFKLSRFSASFFRPTIFRQFINCSCCNFKSLLRFCSYSVSVLVSHFTLYPFKDCNQLLLHQFSSGRAKSYRSINFSKRNHKSLIVLLVLRQIVTFHTQITLPLIHVQTPHPKVSSKILSSFPDIFVHVLNSLLKK